jgi:hypothetical protein
MNHGLGGGAAYVDASATEVFFLDKRDGPTEIGEAMSKRIAGLAGADNDGVVLHGDPPLKKGDKTIHRMRR